MAEADINNAVPSGLSGNEVSAGTRHVGSAVKFLLLMCLQIAVVAVCSIVATLGRETGYAFFLVLGLGLGAALSAISSARTMAYHSMLAYQELEKKLEKR